jgi:hypothetical protein
MVKNAFGRRAHAGILVFALKNTRSLLQRIIQQEVSLMKPKPKAQVRKRVPMQSRRKAGKIKRASPKQTNVSPNMREFAKTIWPGIGDATKFVQLPEFQGAVTYSLPSGKEITTSLKWYTFSHGSRIFGHYDDENNVCYIGKFVEG